MDYSRKNYLVMTDYSVTDCRGDDRPLGGGLLCDAGRLGGEGLLIRGPGRLLSDARPPPTDADLLLGGGLPLELELDPLLRGGGVGGGAGAGAGSPPPPLPGQRKLAAP
jgi:hypothetical protein